MRLAPLNKTFLASLKFPVLLERVPRHVQFVREEHLLRLQQRLSEGPLADPLQVVILSDMTCESISHP